MDKFRAVLLSWLMLLAHVSMASGCMCYPASKYQKLMASDYAIRAQVLWGQSDNHGNTAYSINVIKVFEDGNVNFYPFLVFTRTSSAACGVKFQPGHEYLISGLYVHGVGTGQTLLTTNACAWIDPWVYLTPHDKDWIKEY